jgi:hypothetical protein
MATKIYFTGNYAIIIKASGAVIEGPSKEAKVVRTAAGVYDVEWLC